MVADHLLHSQSMKKPLPEKPQTTVETRSMSVDRRELAQEAADLSLRLLRLARELSPEPDDRRRHAA